MSISKFVTFTSLVGPVILNCDVLFTYKGT